MYDGNFFSSLDCATMKKSESDTFLKEIRIFNELLFVRKQINNTWPFLQLAYSAWELLLFFSLKKVFKRIYPQRGSYKLCFSDPV